MPDFLRLSDVAAGAPSDWILIFTLVSIATFYFLAPVLGYQSASREMLLYALYVLIACLLLTLLETGILYLCYLSVKTENYGRTAYNLHSVFTLIRMVLYIAAVGLLVFGLSKLRRAGDVSK